MNLNAFIPRHFVESIGVIRGIILFNAKNHSAKDKQICPIWAKKQVINKIMTIKKIARKEVFSTYSVSQNYSLLENYDGNFPPFKDLKVNAVLKNTATLADWCIQMTQVIKIK